MKRPKPLPVYMSVREYTWGIRYLLFQLIFLPSLLVLVFRTIWPEFPSSGLNFIFYLINFTVVVLLLRNYLTQAVAQVSKNLVKILGTAAVGFALYWLSSTALSMLISHLMPQFHNVNDTAITAISRDNILLLAIGTVVFVPTTEELLYRGLVFGLLRRRSRILAYAVSVLLFCSIHVVSYLGYYEPLHLLACFIQYIPAGLVLAGAYEFSGSIFTPILIHTAVNAIGIISMR